MSHFIFSEFYYYIFKIIANFKNLVSKYWKGKLFCELGETSYKLSVNICTKFLYFVQIRIHNYLMQPFWIINEMVNYWLIYVRSSFIPEIRATNSISK